MRTVSLLTVVALLGIACGEVPAGAGGTVGSVPPVSDVEGTNPPLATLCDEATIGEGWEAGPPAVIFELVPIPVDDIYADVPLLAIGRITAASDGEWNTPTGELCAKSDWESEPLVTPIQFQRIQFEVDQWIVTPPSEFLDGNSVELISAFADSWDGHRSLVGSTVLLAAEAGPYDWLGESEGRTLFTLYDEVSYELDTESGLAYRLRHVTTEGSFGREEIRRLPLEEAVEVLDGAVEPIPELLDHAENPRTTPEDQIGYGATVFYEPQQPVVTDVP